MFSTLFQNIFFYFLTQPSRSPTLPQLSVFINIMNETTYSRLHTLVYTCGTHTHSYDSLRLLWGEVIVDPWLQIWFDPRDSSFNLAAFCRKKYVCGEFGGHDWWIKVGQHMWHKQKMKGGKISDDKSVTVHLYNYKIYFRWFENQNKVSFFCVRRQHSDGAEENGQWCLFAVSCFGIEETVLYVTFMFLFTFHQNVTAALGPHFTSKHSRCLLLGPLDHDLEGRHVISEKKFKVRFESLQH